MVRFSFGTKLLEEENVYFKPIMPANTHGLLLGVSLYLSSHYYQNVINLTIYLWRPIKFKRNKEETRDSPTVFQLSQDFDVHVCKRSGTFMVKVLSAICCFQTREELRNALEEEIRGFNVDKDLSSAYVISWNHQEFEVQYHCLMEEIKIGRIFITLSSKTWIKMIEKKE